MEIAVNCGGAAGEPGAKSCRVSQLKRERAREREREREAKLFDFDVTTTTRESEIVANHIQGPEGEA